MTTNWAGNVTFSAATTEHPRSLDELRRLVAGADAAPTKDVEATVSHLNERPLRAGDKVLLKHTTRTVRAL
ncbi:hypothetical protein ACFV4N_42020, partial [Actinosynnema sp. NPDC059797]